ncbi:electron transfer flavoprotein subunit alpha/FixB family protein [bacterium]|nr:electron transfer flavoprotein subunit alpha/FixB family protein [bacterium]
MSNDVFVIAEHLKGKLEDVTFELLGKGRDLAEAFGGKLTAILLGSGVKDLTNQMGAAHKVIYADHDQLRDYNPEAYSKVLVGSIQSRNPKLILVANTSMGMDLAAGLSVDLNLPLVAYATAFNVENDRLIVTSQLYGGKVSVESECEGERYIASVIAGSFPAEKGKVEGSPEIEEVNDTNFIAEARVRFKKLIEPEGGDVDITQQPILVSVGRGIQSADNIPIVQELADSLGGALSSSRPIVDSKWLPKTRQVGKSGVKVKPKLYFAVGISGAPEHIEGMKDAELILAINTDPKAPIFDYAHYGVTADLFEIVPALTAKLKT